MGMGSETAKSLPPPNISTAQHSHSPWHHANNSFLFIGAPSQPVADPYW